MLLVYTIRYSGKNIADLIRNVKYDNYKSLMLLENKLLEICSDEQQDPKINVNDIHVAESFEEKQKPKDKKISEANNAVSTKNVKKIIKSIKRMDDDI